MYNYVSVCHGQIAAHLTRLCETPEGQHLVRKVHKESHATSKRLLTHVQKTLQPSQLC